MSNFFFGNREIAPLDIEPKNKTYSTHPCLDPDESRTFYKGKSFRCWEWELHKDRLFINDEFFQDFVIYKGDVYICVNNTTTIPGTSSDWVLFLKSPKGFVVNSRSDLINLDTFLVSGAIVAYNGMTVSVIDSGELYMLLDKDNIEKPESWVKIGGNLSWTKL